MTRIAVPIPILIPRIAAAVVALFVLTAPAAAQTAEEAAAFRGVISAQVDAFRADAWDRAFSYASPSIHALFGSSEQFRSMVMGDYVAVARPQVFEFEEATTLNGHPTQPVFVVGPDGIARRALYFMEQQPDGSWKIDGVVLETLPDRTS